MKELFTERLILREWKEDDSKDLYEYAKNELVGPSAGWTPHKDEEESKEIIRMFIEKQDSYAIELKSEKKVIGGIGLHDRESENDSSASVRKEIGYVLNPKYWGREIVPEAVRELIRYSFEELELDEVWCGHFDFNNNSKRVIEKCEFKYRYTEERTIKQLGDKIERTLCYSILRSDYI